jgi:hypothetical protein
MVHQKLGSRIRISMLKLIRSNASKAAKLDGNAAKYA